MVKKYHILGYPSILFLRPDGTEIDRIYGYLPPDEFLSETKRFLAGDSTFEAWRQRVKEDPNDVDAKINLAEAFSLRKMMHKQISTGKDIVSVSASGSADESIGKFFIADAIAQRDTVSEPLVNLLKENPDHPYQENILQGLITVFRRNKDVKNEVWAYREMVGLSIKNKQITDNLLNAYAWRMSMYNINLEDALEKIILAIAIADKEDQENMGGILDTNAEVLWKLGRTEEAIDVMNQCIAIDPEYKYYQNQKAKFEESLTKE